MMKIAATLGERIEIIASNCDFKIRSGNVKYKVNDPCGEYQLDLSLPYDRAIFLELLDAQANETNIEVKHIDFLKAGATSFGSNKQSPAPSRPTSAKGGGGGGGGSSTVDVSILAIVLLSLPIC